MQPQPRQPMTYSFIALLRRTFQIYREHFTVIIGLVAFVTIPLSLLNIIIAPQPLALTPSASGTVSDETATTVVLMNVLALVQTVLITAPLTYLVSEALFERKLTIGEAFSGIGNRFTSIGCGVLFAGIGLSLMALFIIFLATLFPPALVLAGLLLHLIITTSALMFPVLTLENINPTGVISRSWSLGKQRFWVVFGISILIGLIALVISEFIGGGLNTFIANAAPTLNDNLQNLIASIAGDVIGIFIAPLTPIAFTLLYYDIRNRSENLDSQLTTPITRPIDLVTPVSSFRFDRHDWRNIVILSVLGLVVGLLANDLIQQMMQGVTPGLR